MPDSKNLYKIKKISDLPDSSYQAKDQQLYEQMRQLTLQYTKEDLIQFQKPLVTMNSLGKHTRFGAINPGVISVNNQYLAILRGESHEAVWEGEFLEHQSTPVWCVFDSKFILKETFPLKYSSIPPSSRPEDWRLFKYQNQIYASHAVYILEDRERWVVKSRPAISVIDLETRTLTIKCMLEPPFFCADEEKNWSFFEHKGRLLCIYSFSPYIILEVNLATGSVSPYLETSLKAGASYQWYNKGRFIGNSSNLIEWDEKKYILFIHDFLHPLEGQRNRAYMQYAALIDKETLLLTHVIPRPLIMGGDEPGRHPGVFYISSVVQTENSILGFYGKGDSHSAVVAFERSVLAETFANYPLYQQKKLSSGFQQGVDPRKGIIISYHYSGLNWLRYSVEALTGLATPGRARVVESGDIAFYRTHNTEETGESYECNCSFYDKNGVPLHQKAVLILRDYRECFIRRSRDYSAEVPVPRDIIQGQVYDFNNYFNNLKSFDRFKGEKLLIRYPDLISDFSTIIKIMDFLDLSYDLTSFNVEESIQKSLHLYTQDNKSFTQNYLYDFSYHQDQVSTRIVKAIDAFAEQFYPELIDRYFK